jgi:hypothetical protein
MRFIKIKSKVLNYCLKILWWVFPQRQLLHSVLRKAQTRMILNKFIRKLKKSKSVINIIYDLKTSPPTYGDFYSLVMLGRFLSMSGYELNLIILESQKPYKYITKLNTPLRIVLKEYEKIASFLLPQNTSIQTSESLSLTNTGIFFDTNILFFHSPYILELLIKKYKWPIPDNFLLKPKSNVKVPYIAWHVRKSKYDRGRNNKESSIVRDFNTLSSVFPEHSIMLFGDQASLQDTFAILRKHKKLGTVSFHTKQLIKQPAKSFSECIDYLLECDFYFQRAGGGIGAILFYSSKPYLVVSPLSTYCKPVPQLRAQNQFFLVDKKNTEVLLFDDLFLKIKSDLESKATYFLRQQK